MLTLRLLRCGYASRRPGGIAAAAVLVLAGLLPPGQPLAQTPPQPDPLLQRGPVVQQGVEIRGNRRIEDATILSYMGLSPNEPVTAEGLNVAVRTLFETGLFANVQIVPAADGRLVVVVEENPIIGQIAFEGNDDLDDEELEQIIQLRPRLPFVPARAEADAAAILEVYRRTGRYNARVEPFIIRRPDNRVDLVFEIDEGGQTGICSIDFVGNSAYSDRRLRGAIETDESGLFSFLISTDFYDPDRLELDQELLRRYYLSRGFADFRVLSATPALSADRECYTITFAVEEGPRYTFGDFRVLVNQEGLDPQAFAALIPGGLTGDTFDAGAVEEIADEMKDLAGQQGYAFVDVNPRADKDAQARVIDVTFELDEGPRVFVERIDIEGNTRTLDRVIRREIDLVEGDPFDARAIREARADIRGLDYFERVDIEVEPGSAEDRAVLNVEVEEKSTGSISFGVGYSTGPGIIGNVALTERNFLGRGQTVRTTVTAAGETQIYDFAFTEPRFLDRDLALGFRGFYLEDDRTDESSFNQNRFGLDLFAGFPLSEDAQLRPTYSFVSDDISIRDDASPAIVVDEGKAITSSVGYRLTYDKRNDPLEPTGGYLMTLDQEVAGLGGDRRFAKTSALAKGWVSLLDEALVTSAEIEGGALFNFGQDSRVTERYFLGGQSLRGFRSRGIGPRDLNTDDTVGGNFFTAVRLATSFPLGLPEELGIFGGAFVDAGTVWGLDRTSFGATDEQPAVTIDDDPKLRLSAGGLLFIDSPFGPLEFSIGFPLIDEDEDEDEIFRFSVGTRF
ncbi:MAG TPA: outer membrane protein assembly factor BamA [Thermohalobaculum sp.]|nr:outer membrane protein assembly factor BamA [Thermohalobaculum sp.]